MPFKNQCFWLCVLLLLPALAMARIDLQVQPENGPVRNNIEAHLESMEGRSFRELQRYARHARVQVANALQALGYYRYELDLRVEETGQNDEARLLIQVNPGEPVRLRRVDLQLTGEARNQSTFTLPTADNLRPGQALNHGAYESAKRHFRNQALRYGYFKARFEQQLLEVDPEAGTADIHLHFDSGPRYRFGPVTFDHEGHFDEGLLQRYVRFQPGTPYDTDLLTELSRDLRASGYFREVLADAHETEAGEDLQIPVDVLLRVREPKTLGVGLGYSTDIGPRISTTWTHYWVNSKGHSRGLDTEFSMPRQVASTWYQIPLQTPMTDRLWLGGSVQQEDFDDQESLRYGAGIQWHHRMDSGWDRVLSLRGERERFQVGLDEGATWLILPGIGFGRLQGDRRIDPSRGYRLQLDLIGSHEDFFSDVNLLQTTFFARGLITFWERHRLLARVQGGVLSTSDFSEVPVSLRFFTGGDQSVRGYSYQELAPRDSSGRLQGGRYLMASSLEYQFGLTDQWRLAVFADAGDSVLDTGDLNQPKVGVGAGIRWISPVGPLRIDLARGLDEVYGGWRLHFSMGPEL